MSYEFSGLGEARVNSDIDEPQGYINTNTASPLWFCNFEAHQPQIFRKCYFWSLFHIKEKLFFWKSTLRMSYRYATFVRLKLPISEAKILVPIWCFLIGHKSGYLQEFIKLSFCYGNIFYKPKAENSLRLISLQPQLWVASIYQEMMLINRLKHGRK